MQLQSYAEGGITMVSYAYGGQPVTRLQRFLLLSEAEAFLAPLGVTSGSLLESVLGTLESSSSSSDDVSAGGGGNTSPGIPKPNLSHGLSGRSSRSKSEMLWASNGR
ncbi:hypothetical protein TYRP_001373 [Tyrophagus putrescentiae]|nr:hypothetical protein TYRP_001373 [Tyrophagus putrescentiae]